MDTMEFVKRTLKEALESREFGPLDEETVEKYWDELQKRLVATLGELGVRVTECRLAPGSEVAEITLQVAEPNRFVEMKGTYEDGDP